MHYHDDTKEFGSPEDLGKTVSSVVDCPPDQEIIERMATHICVVALDPEQSPEPPAEDVWAQQDDV
jgi:hypothetical protein